MTDITPPRDYAHALDTAISIHASVWGGWAYRVLPALALLRFAMGLLLPVHVRLINGRPVLCRNDGGALRAKAGAAL